jgi:hypothetical protein
MLTQEGRSSGEGQLWLLLWTLLFVSTAILPPTISLRRAGVRDRAREGLGHIRAHGRVPDPAVAFARAIGVAMIVALKVLKPV